ncbi:methyltransferase, TIGR04325 family [Aquirufa lenticrescens]
MKKLFLLFCPPIFLIIHKKLKALTFVEKPNSDVNNYNDRNLAKMIVEKNLIFENKINTKKEFDISATRPLLGLFLASLKQKSNLNVIDFGGGGGNHYHITKFLFNNSADLNWNIIETEKMTVTASETYSKTELNYFSSLQKFKSDNIKYDLFFASSSLQYCENFEEILNDILIISPKNIFITKTPFTFDKEILGAPQYSNFADNGPGPMPPGYTNSIVSYPIYIRNINYVIEKMKIKYDLLFTVNEELNGFLINNKSYDCFGLYFKLKS